MDIHELKCFSQVAKDNSYSVAAAKLKLSQPALSKIIQRMESELGTELFYTFRRKQRLTDAGEALLREAIRVIHEYDSISELRSQEQAAVEGEIYLGFPPIAGIFYFSELIAGFSRQYPDIQINIREAGSQAVMEEVDTGRLDLGCVSGPVSDDLFDHIRFIHDNYCLVVSSQHPLADRSSVRLEELKDERFIVSDSRFSTFNIIRFACREVGFEPRIALYSSRWDFIVQMVRLNYGISFQPRSIFTRFSFPDVRLLDVPHPAMDNWLELITKKDAYTSRAVNLFIAYITEHAAQIPEKSALAPPTAKQII